MTAPTFQITTDFSEPYFTGIAVSSEVPDVFPVAIHGRGYFLDTEPEAFDFRWRHESLPLLRTQADQAQTPSEKSLNPEGLWRRSQESWHRGAGQTNRDRTGDPNLDDPFRFNTSKGLYVWEQYELTLLNATAEKKNSANTNLKLVSAGARLYCADGSTLTYATTLTGTPFTNSVTYAGGAIVAICSDGFNVYLSDGADLYSTTTSTTTASNINTLNIGGLAYVKGRIMAFGTGATKHILYNLTDTADTTPDYTVTHPNSDFTWVDFADGTAHIFAAGYSGDKSLIYRISIKPDATALDQPIVCGELPDGEIVRAIEGYLGNVWIGSDKGWRFCTVDGQGNLELGVLVETPAAVQCFEPQDRFMWFGWSVYDATSTGLGRADMTQFTGVPGSNQVAYASDLMVTGSGAITSIATFLNVRVFAVSGDGIYCEDTTSLVASGTVESGQVSYGSPDPKTAISVLVNTCPLVGGSWNVSLSSNEEDFVIFGATYDDTGSTNEVVPIESSAERFEIRLTLYRDGSTVTVGPEVLRWTLKSFIQPQDGDIHMYWFPLLLHRDIYLNTSRAYFNVGDEHEFLEHLHATRELISIQEINRLITGTIEHVRWLPYRQQQDYGGSYEFPDGTMLIGFKSV